jgi:hypothetical protein
MEDPIVIEILDKPVNEIVAVEPVEILFDIMCRICQQNGEFVSLFDENLDGKSYADQLEDCFGIVVSIAMK